MSLGREVSTLYANLRGDGPTMAMKYLVFRWLFSVHSRPVSWALTCFAPYPILLEVESSTACNLRCTHCELSLGHKVWGQPAKLMPYDQFVKILDQFPNLIFCDYTGIGEPLLNPDLPAIVSEVKRRKMYLESFDNFFGWDEKVTDFMLDVGLNRVQPSIDGATKETYEAIRVGADFDVVCDNLRYLFAEKKRRGTLLPIIDFHYVVQERNVHEMVAFVHLVADMANGQRTGCQFTELLYEFPGIKAKKAPITEERIKEVFEAGRERGIQIWINRNAEGRPKANMKDCSAWLMPFVTLEGHVYPCCAKNEHGDRAWQNARAMGNIFQQPFREIWTGSAYTELRRKMRQGETPDYCRGCPVFEAKRPDPTDYSVVDAVGAT